MFHSQAPVKALEWAKRRNCVVMLAIGIVIASPVVHAGDSSASALGQIRTISIDPHVVMPASIFYKSAGQIWGQSIGGAVGAGIATASTPSDSIKAKLDQNQIDMAAILAEEMHAALKGQTRFQLADTDAGAVLGLEVKRFGFMLDGPFKSKMRVLLDVHAELIDRNGKVLFQDTEGAYNREASRYTMDDYFADADRLRTAFHEAASEEAAKQMTALLRAAPVSAMMAAAPAPPPEAAPPANPEPSPGTGTTAPN